MLWKQSQRTTMKTNRNQFEDIDTWEARLQKPKQTRKLRVGAIEFDSNGKYRALKGTFKK